jgi:hypothetical protein
MKFFKIFMGTVIIISILVGFVVLIEVLKLYSTTDKVEYKTKSACWAAFTVVDLDVLAHRHLISNEENRDIYIKKTSAEKVIKDTIKENLILNSSYYPLESSFLLKDYPVKIDRLEIYNPNQIPIFAPNGKALNNTAVYIELRFPLKIKFVGPVYKKITLVVDTKSFYSQFQK